MGLQTRFKVLAVLSVARAATAFQFQSVAATAPILQAQLDFSPAQIGLLVGLYMLPGIAVALPGGLLGARFGDKRTALAACALMAAGALGLAASPGFAAACAARIVAGIGAALFNVVVMKMACDWFVGHGIERAMAVLVTSWPIGIGLAFAVLGTVADRWSPSVALATPTLAAALSFALIRLVYVNAPGAATAAQTGLAGLDAAARRLLVSASWPWMFYTAGFVVLTAFAPLYAVAHRGADPATAGWGVALNSVAIVVFGQVGGAIVHRTGRADAVVYVGYLGALLATVGLLVAPHPVFWLALAGAGGGLGAGVLSALPSEVLRPQCRSVGMGLFFTVYYAGVTVFPALAGRMTGWVGTTVAAMLLAAALLAGCIGSYAAFRRAQRSQAASAARMHAMPAATNPLPGGR